MSDTIESLLISHADFRAFAEDRYKALAAQLTEATAEVARLQKLLEGACHICGGKDRNPACSAMHGEQDKNSREVARLASDFQDAENALREQTKEVARLREELATTGKRANSEAQLACDLRSSQDEIIERCAKAVEEWPDAAKRLRSHCANSESTAVSGEDFGQLRRELAKAYERISWLEQQREVEVQQKEAALNESGECLKQCDTLRQQIEELEKCWYKQQQRIDTLAESEARMRATLEQARCLAREGVCLNLKSFDAALSTPAPTSGFDARVAKALHEIDNPPKSNPDSAEKIDYDKRIDCAAIQSPDGLIWTGLRHHHCIKTIIQATGKKPHGYPQGFVTMSGRFVDRIEGAQIALASGQVKQLESPPNLYSEDLYTNRLPTPRAEDDSKELLDWLDQKHFASIKYAITQGRFTNTGRDLRSAIRAAREQNEKGAK